MTLVERIVCKRVYSSKEKEKVLTEAALNASIKLGISDSRLAEVLKVSRGVVAKFQKGEKTLDIGTVPFQNAVQLVRLFESLFVITGGEQHIGEKWMKSHNTAFKDHPINCIVRKTGLIDVVKYLDSRRAKI